MSTDLHFCNFCQQSVPQEKIDTGDAIRHGGRVVCPTCCDTLVLATHSRDEPVKPPSQIIPLAVGICGCVLALFAWFSLDILRGEESDRFEARRGNVDVALVDLRTDLENEIRANSGSAGEIGVRVDAMRGELDQLAQAQQDGFTGINLALEPLGPMQDVQAATAARVELLETAVGLLGEQLQDTRTQQEFLRDELDHLARVAERAGPVPPPEGAFSEELAGLIAQLEDDDPLNRATALESLGKHDDPRLSEYVEPLLDDSYEMNRFYAAYALGEMAVLESCGSLVKALNDDYSFVRKAAFEALQKISGQNHPFDHKANATDRVDQIANWQAWWDDKEAELRGPAAGEVTPTEG